jgi:hypothetical protein
VNSIRRKNVPPTGSLEYWSERTMFAPAAARKVETALMMPGRSGQVMTSRELTWEVYSDAHGWICLFSRGETT